MAFAPDGRLFVCEKGGALRVIDAAGNLLTTPFLTVTVNASGERGLIGVAFDPDFANNHYVYIYYTATTPAIHNRISRFTADTSMPANGNVAVANSEFVLMDLEDLGSIFHNGGALHFGPDGKLYAGVGENEIKPNAQSLSNRLGKILRINTDAYNSIPSDNPTTFPGISGSSTGVNRAIWAVGLRNPFTFAFQPGTGRMFINDVGEGAYEEVNDGIPGSNYGWSITEGPFNPATYPNFRNPIYSYPHSGGNPSAITGGAFYNPSILQFPSSYVGKYFFGDYARNFIRVMELSNYTAADFATSAASPVDVDVGPDGALYYLSVNGQVTRIQATPSQAINISTRARVELNDNVLIGGFIITGNAAKKVIIRAIGPSLSQYGLSDLLADPTLELHNGSGALITSNDNWQDDQSQATQISQSGYPPPNSLESAIITTLQPGNYTAIVRGKNSGQGIALVEVYDLDPAASSQLGNISGRANVQTNDNVMIGGFIVGNNIGACKVIVRAIGPTLSQYGLSNVLADPVLELHDGSGALIQSNDNWQDDPDQAAQIAAANLVPPNLLESAIFTALAPGNYTAIVRGKNNGVGIALVEVYKIP
jgi:glucose/arabinose dehydrogenase